MKTNLHKYVLFPILLMIGCGSMNEYKKEEKKVVINKNMTAEAILGNPDYLAMSYGGFRKTSRDIEPTILEIKEDMKILSAMGVKIIRTYNVHLQEATTILEAITKLKKEDETFQMYVMLGAWIDCKNAWTNLEPNHDVESDANAAEIDKAVALASQYPEIVKIIAVGNEAMVKWATAYYVQPTVILKWVNHLQELKKAGRLPADLWITSSDNFASWGGGESQYHVPDLEKLIKAVDYISMHTYPMHDTHYNPTFWGVLKFENALTKEEKINASLIRAVNYSKTQYNSVENYMKSWNVNKPIHIGETGWASTYNEHYGNEGSKATDEYKQALFYDHMRTWTNEAKISYFYFEAFDEQWKDGKNPAGSENHFGLFTVNGQAKYALWNLIDKNKFKGLTRNGYPIEKTYDGNKEALLNEVLVPNVVH